MELTANYAGAAGVCVPVVPAANFVTSIGAKAHIAKADIIEASGDVVGGVGMPQRMMLDQFEDLYRGQAAGGQVVTVDPDAMNLVHRKAGNGVFDPDWWVETLTRILEHWGVFCKRWTDPATLAPRMHFSVGQPKPDFSSQASGPLSERLLSGPLDRNKT